MMGKKPSPLAGEGDGRQGLPAGEGEAARATPLNRARDLRHNMTDAEHALWRILRNRQFVQTKFRRQVPIGHSSRVSLVLTHASSSKQTAASMRDRHAMRSGMRGSHRKASERCGSGTTIFSATLRALPSR